MYFFAKTIFGELSKSLLSSFVKSHLHGFCTRLISAVPSQGQPLLSSSKCMLQPMQVNMQPVRTRILFDFKGKPQTAEEVPDRFFRLHNGLWIRTQAGRHKRRWKKQPVRVHRLKQHIFCNRTQCQMLDKMVNLEYKVPRHLVNDPYAPYHRKSNLPEYRYSPPKFLP